MNQLPTTVECVEVKRAHSQLLFEELGGILEVSGLVG